MSAAAALATAEAAGLRFRLVPGGGVKMEAAAPPPPELLNELRRWREDVAHLLAIRDGLLRAPAPIATDWQSLPYGRERGITFAAARSARGACSCCAGRRWWRGEGIQAIPRCATCHPPPPGLVIRGG